MYSTNLQFCRYHIFSIIFVEFCENYNFPFMLMEIIKIYLLLLNCKWHLWITFHKISRKLSWPFPLLYRHLQSSHLTLEIDSGCGSMGHDSRPPGTGEKPSPQMSPLLSDHTWKSQFFSCSLELNQRSFLTNYFPFPLLFMSSPFLPFYFSRGILS